MGTRLNRHGWQFKNHYLFILEQLVFIHFLRTVLSLRYYNDSTIYLRYLKKKKIRPTSLLYRRSFSIEQKIDIARKTKQSAFGNITIVLKEIFQRNLLPFPTKFFQNLLICILVYRSIIIFFAFYFS